MAVVTKPATQYNHQTAGPAHDIMVAVDDMLQSAGMTPAVFTGSYDPTGSSSQMVASSGVVSPWMAYNFPDAAQSTHPITVWVALEYQRAGNSASVGDGNYAFLPCFRISEGVDGSGTPLGRVVENIPGDAGGVMNTANVDDCFRIRSSIGSFCRYADGALSFFFGVNGMKFSGSTYTPVSSAFDLHIERRRSAADGTIQSGYVALAQPIRLAPSSQFSEYFPAGTNGLQPTQVVNTPLAFTRLDSSPLYTSVGNHVRSGAGMVLNESTTPIVAPVFYRDADGKPTSFQKMFTIPLVTGATDGEIFTLDFSGTERPYLYRTFPSTYFSAGSSSGLAHPPLAALFEWEA